MTDTAAGAAISGDGGNGGGNGGGDGAAAAAAGFSLDTAFDVNAVPEQHRGMFQQRNVGKLGDLVNWAVDAETRAMAGGKIAPDAKLDITQFSPEYQKIFAAKKLETVQSLADSVFNGEKLIGSMGGKPLLAPEPGKLNDWMAKNAETLGVPKAAAEYQWNKPKLADGMEFDAALEERFRDFAHKRALPGEMFQDFADFGAEVITGFQSQAMAKVQQEATEMQAELTQSWGKDFARNREVAQFAARQLGLDGKIVDALARENGNAATLQLLHAVGAKMEGATLISGDGATVTGAKDQAKVELSRLETDAGFSKAFTDASHPGHRDAVEKHERLMKIIHS